MAKIIRPKPVIFRNCKECIYHWLDIKVSLFGATKEIDFCTLGNYDVKDVKGMAPICLNRKDKTKTYAYLKNPEIIPSWCPLEEYEEESNAEFLLETNEKTRSVEGGR